MRSTQLNRTQNMPVKPKLYYWIYKNIMAQSTFSYWMSLHALTQVAWASICVLDDFNISNLLWRNASKKVSELPPISKPNFWPSTSALVHTFRFTQSKRPYQSLVVLELFQTLKQIEKSHRTSRSCSSSTISSMSTVTSSSVRARLSPCQLTSVRLSRLPRSNWAEGAKRF